jgi:hypothetical protein
MLFGETVDDYCENHTKHTNISHRGRTQSFSMLKQVVHIVTTGILRVKPKAETEVHIISHTWLILKAEHPEIWVTLLLLIFVTII